MDRVFSKCWSPFINKQQPLVARDKKNVGQNVLGKDMPLKHTMSRHIVFMRANFAVDFVTP